MEVEDVKIISKLDLESLRAKGSKKLIISPVEPNVQQILHLASAPHAVAEHLVELLENPDLAKEVAIQSYIELEARDKLTKELDEILTTVMHVQAEPITIISAITELKEYLRFEKEKEDLKH
ncbi:MAG: hypothetical protein ACE5J3_05285 [Methanosarcinales archaeon]